MAEADTLFGAIQPLGSEEYARSQRLFEMQQAAQERLTDQAYARRQTPLDPARYRMGDFWDRQREEEQIQAAMAAPSPEEQMGMLSDRVRQRLAASPMTGVPAEQQREMALRVAYEEANAIGMGDVAAQLGQEYATAIRTRVKKAVELEKLQASTVKEWNEATKSGQRTQNITTANGDEFKQITDLEGNVQSETMTKPGMWKPVQIGPGVWGMQKGDKIVRTNYTTPEDAQAAAKAQAAVDQQMMSLDNTMRVVEEAKGMVSNWNSGLGSKFKDSSLMAVMGNDAMKLKGKISTIKAALTFDKLMEMKSQSKTGASGLGAVSQVELGMLMDSLEALQQEGSAADLIEALTNVQKHYQMFSDAVTGRLDPNSVDWFQPGYDRYLIPGEGRHKGKFFIEHDGKRFEVTR